MYLGFSPGFIENVLPDVLFWGFLGVVGLIVILTWDVWGS
jgi:hypothetical protein